MRVLSLTQNARLSVVASRGISPKTVQGKLRTAFVVRSSAKAEEEKKETGSGTGHQVPGKYYTEDPELDAYRAHQQTAARITHAEEARTLIELGRFGVLSTNDSVFEGFPAGAIVGFASDAEGRPIFSFSTMSSHTADIKRDGRASLTVTAAGFTGAADARFALTGTLKPIPQEEHEAASKLYLSKHPDAYWVTFGDFSWYRMDDIRVGRLVGGFARAGKITAEEYLSAKPDPVAGFSAPVCGHMNEDHVSEVHAMIKHYVGITVDEARMLTIDRLGAAIACKRNGQSFKVRLPFPSEAPGRKEVKERIVEMTKASAELIPFFNQRIAEYKEAQKAKAGGRPGGRPASS